MEAVARRVRGIGLRAAETGPENGIESNLEPLKKGDWLRVFEVPVPLF